jgi:hypothetical protein
MAQYRNDPRWIEARFQSKCGKCGDAVLKGDKVYYYPLEKKVFCKKDDCSGSCERDFSSCAFDEMVYNS